MKITDIPETPRRRLAEGGVIPAHPLALDASRRLDERRQRALSRYYLDAGAAGLAVGVHTTQFAIRDVGLYRPVLDLAAEEARAAGGEAVLVAGAAGPTAQAVAEAQVARDAGFHAVLLSLSGLSSLSEDALIAHCAAVAQEMPLIGFYMQRAVGGIPLPASFWRRFAAIENVAAIKIAPFNRYATQDVVRGVIEAGAEDRITLYTGNDDHIVADLLTPFTFLRDGAPVTARIRGGLLGHWAVWTRAAVDLHARIRDAADATPATEWLALDAAVTAMNAAVFDVENDFAGCIAGVHEVLRRQGLLEGTWCLDEGEGLGPGQAEALDRVTATWPDLTDDAFVAANRDRWLAG